MRTTVMAACLPRLASMLFLGIWILGVVFYMYFGPTNALLGFGFGVAATVAMFWLGTRFPILITLANSSSGKSKVVSRAASMGFSLTDDPRGAAIAFARVFGWLLVLAFGAAALLFAAFTVGLVMQGKASQDVTGASVGLGFFTALTYFTWSRIARAGAL